MPNEKTDLVLELLRLEKLVQELGEASGETEEGGLAIPGEAGEEVFRIYTELKKSTKAFGSLLTEMGLMEEIE